MSLPKINPEAFPGAAAEDEYFQEGMTLRDYFAAKAMQSLITLESPSVEKIAAWAYAQADAMLIERSKP